ncbi:YARHG domain-containing protein [Chryseobacterium sp. CT-SW4]|uniref:YARHG domain-containing protein n=1 Tax=Chryseobacterium sp. SW-1 TaxID=3157343 RepID=UPI003B022D78
MKILNLVLIPLLAATIISCKKETEKNTPSKDSLSVKKDSVVAPEFHKELYGIYTGDFIGNESVYDNEGNEYTNSLIKKLSLKINRITKDSVYGQSIVNGNQRPFRGVFDESSQSFTLDEPGNDKTDGRFEVQLKDDSITGKWTAFNKATVKNNIKKLKLLKKDFVYNPNFMLDPDSDIVDWTNPKVVQEKYTDEETGETTSYTQDKYRQATDAIFELNASKQKLTEKDIKNLRKLDLEIIKNSVFARHGYSFKKATYRNFFEYTDWYIPVSNNVDNDLSPLEKENVALLNRFIKYAEDKYDSFGR